MHDRIIALTRLLIVLMSGVILFLGCDNSSESSNTGKVIRKKITMTSSQKEGKKEVRRKIAVPPKTSAESPKTPAESPKTPAESPKPSPVADKDSKDRKVARKFSTPPEPAGSTTKPAMKKTVVAKSENLEPKTGDMPKKSKISTSQKPSEKKSPVQISKKATEKSKTRETRVEAKTRKDEKKADDSAGEKPDKPSDDLLASISLKEKREEAKKSLYDPKGKNDPFIPLIRREKIAPKLSQEEEEEKKEKKRLTPLERVDLSQIKLVGIILAESGNRALVKEVSGKGYVVTRGTNIGIHSGKISAIKRDRIIVDEEQEEIVGNEIDGWERKVTIIKRELKLQKPPGEDYHEM